MVFFAWWSQRVDNEPPAPFILVAGPGENYAADQAPTITREVEPTVELNLPELTPRPKPPPPRPQPREQLPPPIEKATPAPPKIEPAPEKPAESQRQKVTFDQFAQQHGAPKPRQVSAPKPIKPKTIDVSRLMSDTAIVTAGAGGETMTTTQVSLSKRYVAQIIEMIRLSIEQAGINELRDVGVRFSVSATGTISDVRVTRSSGSAAFDRAVLDAFRDIRPIGPPPTERAEVFTTVIRLTEG